MAAALTVSFGRVPAVTRVTYERTLQSAACPPSIGFGYAETGWYRENNLVPKGAGFFYLHDVV
ncbi:hypothetical protein AB6A23_02405 [Paenibacillus tarimensis]